MPRITFSNQARVYEGNPANNTVVSDPEVLRQFHGSNSDDEWCINFIDPDFVDELGLSGGQVALRFDEETSSLTVSTSFGIESKPEKQKLKQLQGQVEDLWREAFPGTIYTFLDAEIPSSTLVLFMLSEDESIAEHLPDHSVEIYPEDCAEPTRCSWSEKGAAHDFLLGNLESAIANGDDQARYSLGHILLEGELTGQDMQRGFQLVSESAENGNEMASVRLATIYFDGEGVEADPARAEKILQEKVDEGSPMAMAFLAEAYKENKCVERKPERAIELLVEACEYGIPHIYAELGDCYEFGIGTEIDLQAALQCYQLAMDEGFEMVEPAYNRVVAQLKPPRGIFGRIGQMVSSLFGRNVGQVSMEEGFVKIQSDDPEMAAAVQQAQASLNTLIDAIHNPVPDGSVSVKVKVEENNRVEYIWMNELKFENGHFYGEINNDPVYCKKLKIGDSHKAHPNDVNDWLIVDAEGNMQGGYTIEILQSRS